MSKKMRSNILLLITAAIWGSAFVAQKSGMDYIGPLTYGGIRTFIGGLALIPVILFLDKGKSKTEVKKTPEEEAAEKKLLIIGGICCGLALFVASTLQQYGVSYTTAGKAGFITTLYVVMVPIFSVVLRKKVRPIIWLCVLMGATGLYLLCMTDASFKLQFGDTLVLLCAVGFSVHILVIDYFAPKVDGVKMSCIQFLVAGAIGIIGMFIFEEPKIDADFGLLAADFIRGRTFQRRRIYPSDCSTEGCRTDGCVASYEPRVRICGYCRSNCSARIHVAERTSWLCSNFCGCNYSAASVEGRAQ